MPEDDPVLASEPVEWVAEFRFFVRDRRVRAWSPYWLHGALARKDDEWVVDPDLVAMTRGLVDRLLDDPRVDLPVALVLDAGVIRDVGPAVVEAKTASGAGIYGCDPREVLEVLRAATVEGRRARGSEDTMLIVFCRDPLEPVTTRPGVRGRGRRRRAAGAALRPRRPRRPGTR